MELKLFLILFALVCRLGPALAQVSFGKPEKVNHQWAFVLNDVPNGADVRLDDSAWKVVDLPHDWSIGEQLSPTLASASGYLPGGIGWYRKHLPVAEGHRGEKVYLYFEGVYNRSEVFVNGVSVGKRPNGYISFMYDITPHIQFGKDNVIAVRVDHSRSADSRWYTGSGIYRNVWIVYADPVHLAQWGVYTWPEKQGSGYRLNVESIIENGSAASASLTVKNELFDANKKRVAASSGKLTIRARQTGKLPAALKIANPELWTLSHPALYTLKTSIYRDGVLIDQANTITGFRTFTFDPDRGFALNGEWMKVKGVCLHHDAGVLGSAVPGEVWKRRLLTLKEIGVNAIRTSHNPQAPDLYDLCDELGLLVLDEAFDEWEFPKRKWLEGWNVGAPGYQGSFDFFEAWGEKDLADMVRRDRNHPSVFAWSIGNEVDYPNDPYSHPALDGGKETGFTQPIFGGYKKDAPDAMRLGAIAKRLVGVVKQHDQSRPVTAGLAGVAMSNQTAYPFSLDITGYNYTESLYDHDHAKYPERVIFGSENRHDPEAWKAVTSREFIFGQFLWTGIDYLGESGRWPSRGFHSGLLDFGGFIKPRGYFRQSLWSEKPMAYIGTYPAPGTENRRQTPSMDAWAVWNYREGQLIRVVCYTNAAQARLLLNGKEAGEAKPHDDHTGIIYWDIPFSAGKLEVVGMDGHGKEESRYSIQSSERPYAILVMAAEKETDAGRLAQVVLQVVDEHGVPVMLSDDEVTCHIEGPAKLLGLEASDNRDMSDYTDNRQRVYHGRLLAYIRPTGQPGEIKLLFTANWLKPAELTIQVR